MARGYNVVLGHAQGRADEALALTAVLETRHCDAIVLLGDMQDQPRLLADLRDSIVPVVALWQGSSPSTSRPWTSTTGRASRPALEHLVGLGPRSGSPSSAAARSATSESAKPRSSTS